MKTKLLFILILPLLTSLLLVLPARASDTTVSVDPQWNYIDVGENFTVELRLENALNLYGWQVALSFNASVLNVVNVAYAPDHIFNGHVVVEAGPIIDNVEGYVLHCACLLGNSDSVSGSGGLDVITFTVVTHGESLLHVVREGEGIIKGGFATILVDPLIEEIAFASTDGHHHNHLQGDITGPMGKADARVNMIDIAYLISQYDTTPSSPNWNPKADLSGDGKVDMRDVNIALHNFGLHWP
jgi:hypothetical protein